ncbi:MAG: T9SS type A sorting domain-containing protein [Bacteroidia bacterium]|nr:T9SS type A sorting domain-containing protein [Bacteroidia bacterium]
MRWPSAVWTGLLFSFLWAQLSGIYTIGPSGNYSSVSAALSALNSQGLSGPVRFEILPTYTGEPSGTTTLNVALLGPYPGMGTHPVTLTVHSSVTTPVTIATAPVAGLTGRFVFRLNGVDNFTIDGGPNRLLRFRNNSPSTGTGVIGLVSDNSIHNSPCRNITIRNVEVDGGNKNQTWMGIYVGQVDNFPGPSLVPGNHQILIEGCWIYGVQEGIVLWGYSGAQRDQNSAIRRCKIGHPTLLSSWGGDAYSCGIAVANQTALRIEGDTVFNASSSTEYGYAGIAVGYGSLATTFPSTTCTQVHVAGNWIHTIEYTGTGGWDSYGLRINVDGLSDARIYAYNNFIAGILADGYSEPGGTWNAYGIRVQGATSNAGVYLYHNSIHLFGNPPSSTWIGSQSNPACVGIESSITGGIYIRNNIFQNRQTPVNVSANHTTIGISYGGTSPSVFAELDRNVYYVANTNGSQYAFVGSIGNSRYGSLAAWRSAVGGGREQNSLQLTGPAPFASNINLTIPDGTSTPIEGAGSLVTTPIPILTDIYRNARPEGSPNPDAGAVEFVQVVPPCPSVIEADQISLSPSTLSLGTAASFTISVVNPANVTQPAQWEISTNGGPWAVYAPYQGGSLVYTPTVAGTYSFRLVARVARYHQSCPGLQNDTSNVVTGTAVCPSALSADQISVSPTSIPVGQPVQVTVQNPTNVTVPAQWEVSTNGGATWTPAAPYAGSPYLYIPTVIQPHQIRLSALPPQGCSGSLSPVYSNVVSFAVLPPAGNTQNDPIDITPRVFSRTDTVVNGNNSLPGYTDTYTGPNNQPSPDVFYMYVLRECLDSIHIHTCATSAGTGNLTDSWIHVINITASRSLDSDFGYCPPTSGTAQWDRAGINGIHDPNATGHQSLGNNPRGGIRLQAGDTLLIVVEGFLSDVGAFTLAVEEFRYDPNNIPVLPQPPFFAFDTSRVCYQGAVVRDSLNTGILNPTLSHRWYLNGQPVSGVTGSLYRPQFTAPGLYEVVVEIRSASLSYCAPPALTPRDTVYVLVDSLPKVDFLVDGSLYEHAQFVTISSSPPACVTYQASIVNPAFRYTWRIKGSTYTGAGPHQECYTGGSGMDTVVLTTRNGACVEIDTLYIILDLSTTLMAHSDDVTVFPNPTREFVYLYSGVGGGLAQIELSDLRGQLLSIEEVELQPGVPLRLRLPSLPTGLYLLKLRKGDSVFPVRLLVE